MGDGICKITGLTINDFKSSSSDIKYGLQIQDQYILLTFCKSCYDKINMPDKWYAIKGLILNNRLPQIESEPIHWERKKEYHFSLKEVLTQIQYPKTPKEKLDNLFTELYKLQKFDGEIIDLHNKLESIYEYWYFNNEIELKLYLYALQEKNDIQIQHDKIGNIKSCQFTYTGLNSYIKMNEEGSTSNKCFIAMAFQSETNAIRESIKSALKATNFEAIIIDEKNIQSDKTINDEIIASLRQCKFCISDFSFHKNGVYFESGFALGQGKPVIYTCQKKHFENAHFDIKPLQHIIYETPQELESKLISKIEAWIK